MSEPTDSTRSIQAGPAAGAQREGRGTLGLPQATALIVGSIIGVGIFNLPGSLAAYGPISLFAMALTTVGALALALMFAALSRRLPADGGPYAYARAAFGNRIGFSNAWSYWITAWAGNAAIVVGWVFYVEEFVNKGEDKVWSILLGAGRAVDPGGDQPQRGQEHGRRSRSWTTILKFVPLVFMSTVGPVLHQHRQLHPWNVSGETTRRHRRRPWRSACSATSGVETAAVAAAKVRDPERNIPRATCSAPSPPRWCTCCRSPRCSASCPRASWRTATAPFSVAANAIFGGTWAGNVMAAWSIVSGFGALNGWTMICAEMPLAAAKDGLFPEPFGGMSARGVPAFGIVASTVLASIAMVFNYLGSSGATVFTTLVLMSGITAAIPYALLGPGADQVAWRTTARCTRRGSRGTSRWP